LAFFKALHIQQRGQVKVPEKIQIIYYYQYIDTENARIHQAGYSLVFR